MKNSLKRILAALLVLCSVVSYTLPAASAAAQKVTYDFNQLGYYTSVPAVSNKSNPLISMIQGYTLSNGTVKKAMTQRYLDGEQNWTYEAASTGLCGSSSADEHLPSASSVRMLSAQSGLRIAMGKNQDDWIAFRFRSPGAGTYTMDLKFYSYKGAPTVAFYILEAEGEASAEHDTVLARQERIHNEMDPGNRVGKVNQDAGKNSSLNNTAYIGQYTFEAGKEYILVAETYAVAAVPEWYACFANVTFTKDGKEGTPLKGEPEVNYVRVLKNAVPASDGGYMGALVEIGGHDYFFLPLEGSRMAVYDLDDFTKTKNGDPLMTVNTGLYYPTNATVTDDGKVIVGGDSRKLFVFDTKTMTGRMTPDFRSAAGFEAESHIGSSFYNTEDKLIYFGTSYGGSIARYDMASRTFQKLADVVCREVQEMALGRKLDNSEVDDSGTVKGIVCHGGFAYALANSDRYHILVKYDLTQMKLVGALDVTKQISGGSNSWGLSVLGDRYVIAGATGVSGMALVDIATFSLVSQEMAVSSGMITNASTASDAWEGGMTGHASEVIDGKQYFFVNSSGMYSYELATGIIKRVGTGQGSLRTGAKSLVTLDRNKDGVEEQYLFTYAGGGQPRLYKPTQGNKISVNGLKVDMTEAGGSSINIGDSYDDVLYIGAWNNYNCVAYDTGAEAVKSRYVTGGQTDSQVSYVDENGQFHLVSGNYSACVVYEIDPDNKTGYDDDSNIIKPLISQMKQYEQKRIHTVEGGDGYVFAGTIPTSYVNGGGVGVYNRETGTEDFIRFKQTSVKGEKVVPNEELWDLSVTGLEYYDGLLYGVTTRSGGSGSSPVDGTSARIFVMDYKNMTIEATLDLRDYLTLVDADNDGMEDPILYIDGLTVDDQGRFWGTCADVLFCFTYNKTEKTFAVQEILNLNHSEYVTAAGSTMRARRVVLDPDNYQIFVSFHKNGLQQITLGQSNWTAAPGNISKGKITRTTLVDSGPETMALGANNNLYYADGTNLYMKPVNVKDSEWAQAQAVDQRITALGSITLEDAAAVTAARNAYEALPLRDKALVQELFTLQEAEAYLMNLQLGEIAPQVTGEDYQTLYEINQAYGEMTSRQKRYVKNYELLGDALFKAATLKQDEDLNQLQKDIYALEAESLEDTETVVELRRKFNAFPEDQSSVLDIEKLLAAEEKLACLWEESGRDIAGGTCGEGLGWVLSGRGDLTISGTGTVEKDPAGYAPWYTSSAFVKRVIIEDGVTGISDGAFDKCINLQEVFFYGTQAQKDSLTMGNSNEALLNARWHYGAKTFLLGSQTVRQCSCCNGYHYQDASVNVFADVSNTSWQISFAIYACQKGLMAGKGTDTYGRVKFDPNSPITREEFVQVLYNAEAKPAVTISNKFPDVSNTAWYKNAVLWANSRNIANGLGNGSFGVGKNITRQDLALMLYKYASLMGLDLTAEAGRIDVFADGDMVSGYAKTAMNWAVTRGVLSGKGSAGADISTFRLDPAGTATRAECAAMLKNFMTAYRINTDTLPICAHTGMLEVEAKPAGCTQPGNIAYWYCGQCDRYFSDPEWATQIRLEDTVLEATDHSWTAATCTAPRTCGACGETEGEALGHSLSFLETVAPTCTEEGYDLYGCGRCDYEEKQNFTPAEHSYVTMDLPSAALKAFDAGILDYAPYATSSYEDYDTEICQHCNRIDIEATRFRYTQREAAEIMLKYVNDLRAEVYGTHAYDMVLDDWCQSVAEERAVQLTTNYSHSGSQTPGENITSNLSIYEQFIAWKNSLGHYENMVNRTYTRFGYGYAACGDNGFNAAHGYGCQTFNWG